MGDWTTVDEMNEPERARIELIPSAKLWCTPEYHGVQ